MVSDTRFFGHLAVSLRAVINIAVVAVASMALVACDQAPAPPKPEATAAAKPPVRLEKLKWLEEPRPAPQTPFTDGDGRPRTLKDFAGKVVLVNFWATWCAPCIEEMPTLDALQARLGGEDFIVLAINQDREGAKVATPFVERNGWKNLPLNLEPAGQFAKDAALRGLPTSLLIDREGREVARLEGTLAWDAPEVEAKLREVIARR
jgi:thiol-disulfide isomerase/thioredoxin